MSLSREGSSVWLQYRNRGIIRIKKELSDNFSCYGIALDIGTTTVVLYLIDLFSYRVLDTISFLNPQRIYGHDVISRIRYCMQDVKYILQFQQLIIDSISKSIYAICKKNKIRNDRIFKITVVGNTTMLHLFLAEDPSSIALAPFTPRFTQAKLLSGTELHLGINKKAIVHILPSLSGYIGADIIAGVASTPMTDEEAYSLFIDIGTNGEIVLGNSKVIYCCSTAAGPAFEGAAIHDGTGAVEGAISEYHDGHYHTIGNKMPLGICGSGLVDLVAALLKSGKVDKQGYMAENFLVSAKADTALGKDIILTPKDIREVQLAKAAIYAGITLLVRIAEIGYEDIRSVFLAGGFGNYMNIASAMKIGLLPKALKDKVYPVGNSAGTGALFALKSIAFEKYIKKVLKKARYIELSMRQDFYDIYMESMHFE